MIYILPEPRGSQPLIGSSRNASSLLVGEERCVTTLITAAEETNLNLPFVLLTSNQAAYHSSVTSHTKGQNNIVKSLEIHFTSDSFRLKGIISIYKFNIRS